jgi:hypothetical protein
MSSNLVGTALMIPLSKLELDPDNPRLASFDKVDPNNLIIHLEMAYDAITVAESIARHGYFASEPLIVLPADERGTHRIVEGNRRFVALSGLANPEIRREFMQADRWDNLASSRALSRDEEIPALLVDSRRDATPILGYRHISGILDWTPYAQAAFVADRVDLDGHSFDEISMMVGKRKSEVSSLYRNFKIAQQSVQAGVSTTALGDAFSLLTVAMNSPHLRDFIGAPSVSGIEPGINPISEENLSNLVELITWIFGDGTPNSRRVEESRKIPTLGKVVGSSVGLQALRNGDSLDAALTQISDTGMAPEERILRRLNAARNSLRYAAEDIDVCAHSPEVASLLSLIEEEVQSLAAVTRIGLEDAS